MVEAARQQRHYKDNLSHAEIVALLQAYTAKYKNCYKAESNQPCRTGTEKGMECCGGTGPQ